MVKGYKVTVVERIAKIWTKTIEAKTEEEARAIADNEIWNEEGGWDLDYDTINSECGIEEIEEEYEVAE